MKYSKQAVSDAEKELARRREISEQRLNQRKQAAYTELPEIKAMLNKMQNAYCRMMTTVFSHAPNAKELAQSAKEEHIAAQQNIKTMLKARFGNENFLEREYYCRRCHDTGYVEGIRCGCMTELIKKYSAQELSERSTIQLHDFSEFRLDFYKGAGKERMYSNFRYLVNYCKYFPKNARSLLFIGMTGLGKTFLSSCIAKDLASRGFSVVISSISDLLRRVENEHFGRSSDMTLDTLNAADMVIIDDLGSEFRGAFNESALYQIINNRINLRKPTIISTNFNSAELKSIYNERITSRLLYEFTAIKFSSEAAEKQEDIRQQKMVMEIQKNKQ